MVYECQRTGGIGFGIGFGIGIDFKDNRHVSIPIPIAIPTPSVYGCAWSRHGGVLTETRFTETEHIYDNRYNSGSAHLLRLRFTIIMERQMKNPKPARRTGKLPN